MYIANKILLKLSVGLFVVNSPKSLFLIFVCGGGGVRYITPSYIPSYKKTSYNITRSMCKLAYTARLNDRNIFLEYSLITGADVKNISLNNGIIPCAKLVIIIVQGIILLVK